METLKYKIIKNKTQYNEYCRQLELLLGKTSISRSEKEEVELLDVIIEKWDTEHNTFDKLDPIELLHSLMEGNKLKAKDLVAILGISKGLVSDILNYKKGLSKEIIRSLSAYFKLSQEAFNRPYKLKLPVNSHLRHAGVMNTRKQLAAVR
jgi:HTH-type transcriptional regulator/antitoxin HigA